MRLFAALPLPPTAHARLERLRLRLSAPGDGLRWSPPEQWHLTLQFYDEVSEATAGCLLRQLSEGRLPAATLTLEGLGLFPTKGILFASLEASPSLLKLQQGILAESQQCGVVPESRPFHPHITLARSKGRPGQKTLRSLSTPELPAFGAAIAWLATEVLLLQSELHPQGARYTEIGRVPLHTDGATNAQAEAH